MKLTNKLYLVTGASVASDIGLAICKKLDAEGAKLILVGRNQEALQETKSLLTQKVHCVEPFDLSIYDKIPAWINKLVSSYGPFDGFVHNACFQGYSPLRTISPKLIATYFDINTYAAIALIAALSEPKHFKQNASMVLIGSAAGLRGLKARSLYAASKAALYSIAQSAALELAEKTIRVNFIAPAVVSSVKADWMFSQLGEAQAQALKNAHPLGLTFPEDVANGVYILLSDLSRTMTGSSLVIDGGYLAG